MQSRIRSALILFVFTLTFFTGCLSADLNRDRISYGTSSSAEISYFEDIVLGAEYGSAEPQVLKWVKNPVKVRIYGIPDEQSLTCLSSVISDFNQLSTTTRLLIVDNGTGDIDMHFVPDSQFSRIEPNYVPGNWGFFWRWSNTNCEIYKARILISTKNPTPRQRCHLIREELTQSLGFAHDSLKFRDSIFYRDWTDTISYSEIDKNLIRMLYSSDIPLCATKNEVERYFAQDR
jgi:hypothetical protein